VIKGVVHIGITVLNFDAMLAFYRDVLGLSADPIVPHPRGGRKAVLRGAEREVIEMIEYPNAKPHQGRDLARTGIHHFGLVVADVHAEATRLHQLGVELDGEIKPNSKGELVQHFWDPEGNRLHLTERTTRNEKRKTKNE
jgi:catechol 2,3-dioxygenase-like lactoylglutathione lyase family enzyme